MRLHAVKNLYDAAINLWASSSLAPALAGIDTTPQRRAASQRFRLAYETAHIFLDAELRSELWSYNSDVLLKRHAMTKPTALFQRLETLAKGQ